MPIQRMLPEPPGTALDDREEPLEASPVHWGLYVLGAAMRRKLLAGALLLTGLAMLVSYYRSKTPLYLVEASILVQKTPYSSSDDPARSANVIVHGRENLIDLIKQTNLLVDGGSELRATDATRLPSWLPAFVRGAPQTDDTRLNALVARLDRALKVTTSYDGTITISLEWPDPQHAYRLVEAAQQNFLEARHLQEITAIDEVISILEGRTAMLREQLSRTIEEVQRNATGNSVAHSSDGRTLPTAPSYDRAAARTKAEELASLKSRLDAKERAIGDVEDFRRRRLADLQAQLDEKRGIYSDAYPGVLTLRQDIEALSRESPQIVALRQEAQKLREQYNAGRMATGSGKSGDTGATPMISGAMRTDRLDRAVSSLEIEQDERVREARVRYASMVDRMNVAQLERDSARAAFKHRYNVTWPAEVPTEPSSPKPLKILGGGSMAVLLLTLLCVAAPDLWSGRIVQRWQIERSLDLPVLAELNRK